MSAAPPRLVHRCNRWLDQLPRATVWWTGHGVPAFRAIGVVGAYLSLVTLLVGALLRDVSLVVAVGCAVVAAASFFAWAVLRRLVSGRERLVLFEHAWLAGACVAGYAAAIGQPVWRWLDVFAVALCLFLAVGRLGCLVAGCCHGLPSALGVVYGGEGQDPHPYAGLRLFPVQAVESAVLGATGVIGLLALPGADDGDVLLGLMVTYAIARFGTEALRGDRRPRILGIPVARAAAVVQLAAALVLSELRHGAPPGVGPRFGVVAAGLVVVTVSWAGGTAGRRAWARGSGRR